MSDKFCLEIFYERDEDRGFADCEAAKLERLVRCLAPGLQLCITTTGSTAPCREKGFLTEGGVEYHYDVPTHCPSGAKCQTLFISNGPIHLTPLAGPSGPHGPSGSGVLSTEGLGWRGGGCLSRPRMQEKQRGGGNSADITIHEWIHAIQDMRAGGKPVPSAHCPDLQRCYPPDKGPDCVDRWYCWYGAILTGTWVCGPAQAGAPWSFSQEGCATCAGEPKP